MYTSDNIMICLERKRDEKKLMIKDLCEGITSTRSYSRYLSGELDLPFDIFAKLLDRMDIMLKDFLIYVFNDWQHARYNEFYLAEYIRTSQFDKAKEVYDSFEDKNFSSIISKNYLPIAIKKWMYETKKISKNTFLDYARTILDLDNLLKGNTVNKEEAESLYLYLEYCEQKDKDRILKFFMKAIFNEGVRILSWTYDVSEISIIFNTLKLFVSKPNYTEDDHYQIKRLINHTLDVIDVIRYDNIYYDFNLSLIKYYKRINEEEKYKKAVYFYYLFILSRDDGINIMKQHLEKEKIPFEYYIEGLKNKELLNASFLEEMWCDDVL